jgi:hypothetical protein
MRVMNVGRFVVLVVCLLVIDGNAESVLARRHHANHHVHRSSSHHRTGSSYGKRSFAPSTMRGTPSANSMNWLNNPAPISRATLSNGLTPNAASSQATLKQPAKSFASNAKEEAKTADTSAAESTKPNASGDGPADQAKHFTALLSNAQQFSKLGLHSKAEMYLRRILNEAPGTRFADQAQQELAALPADR